MLKKIALLALSFCCLLFTFAVTPLSVAAQEKSASVKVAQLLEESGYAYTKASPTVWTVPYQGKVLSDFKVIASTQQDILVLFVIVAEKKDIRLTPELMQKLLKMNSDLDRVKIGIDGDGDGFVRIDLSLRVLDAEEFKMNIEQVAAAADEVYAAMKPFLGSSR